MAAVTNFYIDTGSNFGAVITVKGSDGLPLNLDGYTATSYIRKSYASRTHIDFNAEIFSEVGGQIRVSLDHTDTDGIKPGRYMYDVVISANGVSQRMVEGIVVVNPGVTR